MVTITTISGCSIAEGSVAELPALLNIGSLFTPHIYLSGLYGAGSFAIAYRR